MTYGATFEDEVEVEADDDGAAFFAVWVEVGSRGFVVEVDAWFVALVAVLAIVGLVAWIA